MRWAVFAIAVLASVVPWNAASAAEDFYRGKTIRLVVPSDVGGGYDSYGRVFAQFFRKHIPGASFTEPDGTRLCVLDISGFQVAAAEQMVLVGRSGCGKTTLVKCLAGLLEPTAGTIFYDGVDLKTLNYRELRRHQHHSCSTRPTGPGSG